jgi:hypothetical protein
VVSIRAKAFIGTMMVIVGAFVVGNAIHQTVVEGAYGVTSPPAVIGGLVGLVLIVVGQRLHRPPTAYIDVQPEGSDGGEDGEPSEAKKGNAPEMSPLSDEDLENIEADDTN